MVSKTSGAPTPTSVSAVTVSVIAMPLQGKKSHIRLRMFLMKL